MNSFTLGNRRKSYRKAPLLSWRKKSGAWLLKRWLRSLSLALARTVNRNRFPMLKASSQQNNVGKGSRQLRSVTSGKGLALRVRPRSLWNDRVCRLLRTERSSRTARTAGRVAPSRSRGRVSALFLARGITNSELERTRGIRLFN